MRTVDDEQGRQGLQQPLPDFAEVLVGTDEHLQLAVGVVAPRAHAAGEGLLERSTVEIFAPLSWMDDDLVWRRRVVAEAIRLRSAEHGDVARPQPLWVAVVGKRPRRAVDDGGERQRCPIDDAHRPRRSHHHPDHRTAPI